MKSNIGSSPIFVVGYGHSGTTLLLNILRNNSSVFASHGETKYFEYLLIIKRTYPNLEDDSVLRDFILFIIDIIASGYKIGKSTVTNQKGQRLSEQELDTILQQAKQHRDHGEVFRIVFDRLRQIAGKTRWLEKTPAHIFHINKIIQCIPDAQFIETVRDPRDILASKKTRRRNIWKTDRYSSEEKPRKHLEKGYDPLWDSFSWKSAISAGRNAQEKYPDRILSVQYEHLVSEPEACVRRICDFLHMQFEPEMLTVPSGNPADIGRSRNVKSYGFTTKSIGRWSSVLLPSEISLCQWLVMSEMDWFGYSRTRVDLLQKAKVPFLLIGSILDLFKRLCRKFQLGGFAFFANTVVSYWKRLAKIV